MFVCSQATNFSAVCKELKLKCKDFSSFKKLNPPSYPSQRNLHDCGFYIMLYIEHWNGKIMHDFSKVIILNYRMVAAHKMFHSINNKIKIEEIEAYKRHKPQLKIVLQWLGRVWGWCGTSSFSFLSPVKLCNIPH